MIFTRTRHNYEPFPRKSFSIRMPDLCLTSSFGKTIRMYFNTFSLQTSYTRTSLASIFLLQSYFVCCNMTDGLDVIISHYHQSLFNNNTLKSLLK